MAETTILKTMEKRGIRQAELARRLGRSRTWSWHVVHALLTPSPEDRRAIAAVLRCSQREIFDRRTGRAFVGEENAVGT